MGFVRIFALKTWFQRRIFSCTAAIFAIFASRLVPVVHNMPLLIIFKTLNWKYMFSMYFRTYYCYCCRFGDHRIVNERPKAGSSTTPCQKHRNSKSTVECQAFLKKSCECHVFVHPSEMLQAYVYCTVFLVLGVTADSSQYSDFYSSSLRGMEHAQQEMLFLSDHSIWISLRELGSRFSVCSVYGYIVNNVMWYSIGCYLKHISWKSIVWLVLQEISLDVGKLVYCYSMGSTDYYLMGFQTFWSVGLFFDVLGRCYRSSYGS